MSVFDLISTRIIKEQELIIGGMAWDEARKVPGLVILDQQNGLVKIDGDPSEILERLVAQYSRLFGKASTEACKEAVQDLIAELPLEQIPPSLKIK